jgi:hypothetical protein
MMPLTNAPNEGLPPGCACLLMAPGTTYEARVLDPACRVHRLDRGRVTKVRRVTKRRNDD